MLPGRAIRDEFPPLVHILKTIERSSEFRQAHEVMHEGHVGDIGQSELVSRNVGASRELFVENGEIIIEFSGHLRKLRLIWSLTTGALEQEFDDDVGDRRIVGLIRRKPLLNDGSLLQGCRVERLSSMLGSYISNDSPRLEHVEITIDEDGNLTEGLETVNIFGGLLLTRQNIYKVDFIACARFQDGHGHCEGASRAREAFNGVGRHLSVEEEAEDAIEGGRIFFFSLILSSLELRGDCSNSSLLRTTPASVAIMSPSRNSRIFFLVAPPSTQATFLGCINILSDNQSAD